MTATTLPGVLLTGTHASRPAASAVGGGTLYSCTTHSLIYQSDGTSTWSTWATLTGTGFTNPMANKGELIQGDTAGAAVALTTGTAGRVLVSGGTGAFNTWGFAAFVGAKVYNSTTQNTNSGIAAALTCDTELFDTNTFHDTGSNTSRLTIPSGLDGKYRITGYSFASAAADWLILQKNGTTKLRGAGQNVTAAGRWHVCTIESLVATDYVEIMASSAGSVDWGHASAIDAQTTFMIEYLGT